MEPEFSSEHSKKAPGWRLDNSYARLPDQFYARIAPTPVAAPKLLIINEQLAQAMGLDFSGLSQEELAQLFSGNHLPPHAEPLAQAYAGHQYGHFTVLGDGRAHLLGEHLMPDGARVDIQLKGSGKTPFGRRGDGRAALGPMLREYIISEAMAALGIATTRSLAVVATGEPVMREAVLPGAILTRIAASHIRVGTFEYLAASQDTGALKQLADYAIARHYPDAAGSEQPYLSFFRAVMQRQIALIVEWLRVGFIHGVMNTDNMTISGETIDYGPCAFMDAYDPQTVFSSIDKMGRYAYANQPNIAQWNLARLGEALLPLLHTDIEQAVQWAEEVLDGFEAEFQRAWLAMMRRKLGLVGEEKDDEALIAELLQWMQAEQADYTNTFRVLISEAAPEGEVYADDAFRHWWRRWKSRQECGGKPRADALTLMRTYNPAIIPRNHHVQAALDAAEDKGDLVPFKTLLAALLQPYEDATQWAEFMKPPTPQERVLQTFCGT